MRHLYTLIFYLALPLVLLRLWWRGFKAPAYRQRWWQRLGMVPACTDAPPLWIHAVSVGETIAIAPLVRLLLERQPELPVVMTTMTPTGAAQVQALFGDRVQHFYCPYDLPLALIRFIGKVRPRACVVVETELWPNLVHCCYGAQVPVLLANARLSERSARGYRRFSALTQPMLQKLSKVVAQDEAGAERFLALGLPPEHLRISGSIKFDIAVPDDALPEAEQLKLLWGPQRPVLIGGSTHEGEEESLLHLYKTLLERFPTLLLLLVPRHPERFGSVAGLAEDKGFQTCRRSGRLAPDMNTQVYVGDTMGELMKLYAAADVVVVGGSLIERGGHNPLEPALLGKPVLMGPHVYNFEDICQRLQACGALAVEPDVKALANSVTRLLENPEQGREQGEKGRAFIQANRGALECLYQEVQGLFNLHR